jgi:hypothetical protein
VNNAKKCNCVATFELARCSVTIVRYLKPRTKSSECCLEIRNSQIIKFVLFLCDGRRSSLLGYPHSSYHLSSSRRKYSCISSAIFCSLYLILPHPPSLVSHISSQLPVVGLICHTNTTPPLPLESRLSTKIVSSKRLILTLTFKMRGK